MNLTNENWVHADFSTHVVTKVDFDANDIREANRVALLKLYHTGVYDPNGLERQHKVMLSRIIAGELADQAVTCILNSFYQSAQIPLRAVEYDDVRQDSFVNNSPYSIQIQSNQAVEKLVEVRSSFCYRLPEPKMMISKLSIYGWYTSYGKPAEDPKDLYFQMFYHLRPESVTKQDSWPQVGVFEDALRLGKVTAYVIGGADKQLLLTSGTVKKDDADGAFYQAIYPANSGYDVPSMCVLSTR